MTFAAWKKPQQQSARGRIAKAMAAALLTIPTVGLTACQTIPPANCSMSLPIRYDDAPGGDTAETVDQVLVVNAEYAALCGRR